MRESTMEPMVLAQEDDDASNPFTAKRIISPELIYAIPLKQDEGQRCAQLRFLEAQMKKYDEILSYNRLLCQKLPEEDSKTMFLQIDKDNSFLRTALEQKVNEIGLCPIVNCVYHNNLSNNPKPKRNRTETRKNENSKTQKLADQNEFQLPAKRHTVKLNVNIHSKNKSNS
ncbi:hypothetical protein AVEN_249279-1 [Araneus ventricosus]|uniref:Uncharacterized protein n=1 Tax=Araneus ventricosus TaxID=182803 RepID=A0A4Y2K749_ARAVE|nr:hypothetical protein AVEN_249279-1 [Araneus ventricosus]